MTRFTGMIRMSMSMVMTFFVRMLMQRLIAENHNAYEQLIIVTESIFSMDGDEAGLPALIQLKKSYSNVLLYVDEAHAFGVRGKKGCLLYTSRCV